MPGFDDTFFLNTKSKPFLDGFVTAINAKEKKTGSISVTQQEETFSVKVVGDLFQGNSLSHTKSMTTLLKKCIEQIENTEFDAHYDLHCYTCRDEAAFDYLWDGQFLTVRGSFDNSEDSSIADDDCEGKHFFISGKLWVFEDLDDFSEYIDSFGGIVTETLTDNVDYIICNSRSLTPELKKEAEIRNIRIISEKDFIRFFGDAGEFEDYGISLSNNGYVVETHTKTDNGWEEQISFYESEEEYYDSIIDEEYIDEDEDE